MESLIKYIYFFDKSDDRNQVYEKKIRFVIYRYHFNENSYVKFEKKHVHCSLLTIIK